jgi:hypothetical protein
MTAYGAAIYASSQPRYYSMGMTNCYYIGAMLQCQSF